MRATHYTQQQRYSGKNQYGESGNTLAHRSHYVKKMLKSRQCRTEKVGEKTMVLAVADSRQELRDLERQDWKTRRERRNTREKVE